MRQLERRVQRDFDRIAEQRAGLLRIVGTAPPPHRRGTGAD